MLESLASIAEKTGRSRMEWKVFSWNTAAIDFYRSLGGSIREALFQVRVEREAYRQLCCE
ncbi:GNAT family N-acetyltransferase [Paraburkholderia sediminicola]|uniref:GNAT family N-acetyltransferase n=1 Tax=Paraburkholderia sediminicola TaxID=458836 RepID=UPI0038B754CB